ncbi:MAG: hypothetical protein GXO82_07690, partial [Chlorobi bacterium]|nr:hypothetical protein [Chlorobiota bacterium]
NAPTFDAIRFEARFKTFSYVLIHSSLLSKRIILENGEPLYNPKFLALHRAQVALFDAVDFGVYEAVIYSRRFLDLAYLNPINFFKSAEHSNGDRDNPLLGFDVQTRAIPDLQLYGTWLIDDVDFSRWGTGWFGNKFAWQAGMQTTALSHDMELTLEYTRIEPYVYSHVFPDNSYTHREINLGPTIQPNSYAVSLGLQYWLGYQWRGSFLLRHTEHGANVYDDEGNLVRNTGGDVLLGHKVGRDSETARLLDGKLETENLASLSIRYEPWRNIIWDFVYQFRISRKDNETSNRHFFSLLLLIEY